jgi:hypothetical protein
MIDAAFRQAALRSQRIADDVLGALTEAGGAVVRPAARGARWAERDARERIGGATLAALDTVLSSPYVEEAVERVLASGVAERLAKRVLDGPELERIVASAVDSPHAARIVELVTDSRLADQTVGRLVDQRLLRLRQSDALWALIDEISKSPAVTEAIAQQGRGFADEVADGVRDRSRQVDARLERAAHRLFGRRPRSADPTALPEP